MPRFAPVALRNTFLQTVLELDSGPIPFLGFMQIYWLNFKVFIEALQL